MALRSCSNASILSRIAASSLSFAVSLRFGTTPRELPLPVAAFVLDPCLNEGRLNLGRWMLLSQDMEGPQLPQGATCGAGGVGVNASTRDSLSLFWSQAVQKCVSRAAVGKIVRTTESSFRTSSTASGTTCRQHGISCGDCEGTVGLRTNRILGVGPLLYSTTMLGGGHETSLQCRFRKSLPGSCDRRRLATCSVALRLNYSEAFTCFHASLPNSKGQQSLSIARSPVYLAKYGMLHL